MSDKTEKVIILGKSGAGKDFLTRKLIEKGLEGGLKWTTRPKRKLEKQGVIYNFVTESEFFQAIKDNKFLTYQKFEVEPEGSDPETWYYGITLEEFETCGSGFNRLLAEYLGLGYKDEIKDGWLYMTFSKKK